MHVLIRYVALLEQEAGHQNLIAESTMPHIWRRHILDSLQLLDIIPPPIGHWIDIGSGAGLPGLVAAIAGEHEVTLIEPRRRRAAFLQSAVDALDLGERVTVIPSRCETAKTAPAAVISARAVAPLEMLFAMAERLARSDAYWLLPKGRSAAGEVAIARQTWQGDFRLVPSRTDSDAAIVVARAVRRRELP